MKTLALVLCLCVALEHLFIAYIELFATHRPICSKLFRLKPEVLQNPNIQNLFKNLGIYNLCVALGLLYGTIFSHYQIQVIFLLFIIIVGIYGSLSSKSIFFKQALPALVALVLLALF
ncbi:DUF1304 domain-containing protein [Helicobacter brantae]|uniref:DUF1304 domain-containing protein n=1 Tax=Helicobacter brantae TaxID=375927 RepID=A0A3D8J0Q3_9HELI|nr:DUF1304 family protein [Helicobacter brantae]RDU71119.1 DUF1304 domain-containing protein [Helicobacter brantae]